MGNRKWGGQLCFPPHFRSSLSTRCVSVFGWPGPQHLAGQGVHALHRDPAGRPVNEVLLVTSGEIELDAVALQNGKPRLLVEAGEAQLGGVEEDGGRDLQRVGGQEWP